VVSEVAQELELGGGDPVLDPEFLPDRVVETGLAADQVVEEAGEPLARTNCSSTTPYG
jgi:hypothetical protein